MNKILITIVEINKNFSAPSVEYPHSSISSIDDLGRRIFEYNGYPNDSIALLFGNHVDYRLSLKYHLTNTSLTSADTELAIPPDTEYQKVILSAIDPPPEEIRTDADGNWLAVYNLKSQEEKDISAEVYVSLYPYPFFPTYFYPDHKHTAPAKYWEVKSDSVSSLAASLKNPENIYSYLIENLTYDNDRVSENYPRLGAEETLAKPNSTICTEFTDTFVALSRAAGIPAREINGYARTSDNILKPADLSEDILHAWPEYYDKDKKTWIQVDPTWGKTTGGVNYFKKLDYGHITFVRHGIESTYPHPAGSYKSNPEEKSIEIEIASTLPETKSDYEVKKNSKGYVITNTGNIALISQDIALPDGSKFPIQYLPPFGSAETVSAHRNTSLISKFLTFIRSIL